MCVFIALCIVVGALGATGMFTPVFDKELKYYTDEGHIIADDETFEEYKALWSKGSLIEIKVTAEELRDEVRRIMVALDYDYHTIFVDREAKILWIWGEPTIVNPRLDKMYIYFLKAS